VTLRAGIQVLTAASLSLASVGCRPQAGEKDRASFHITATDAAFEAPDNVPAGLRHILFENHGTEIHESMLVKLAPGVSSEDYVALGIGLLVSFLVAWVVIAAFLTFVKRHTLRPFAYYRIAMGLLVLYLFGF